MIAIRLTRDQQRAQHALRSVKRTQALVEERRQKSGSSEKEQKNTKNFGAEYKSYAECLPASIVMNGLGQACAMLLAQAKGEAAEKDAHRLLYDQLQDWLCGASNAAIYPDHQDLVEAIVSHGQRHYIRAQVEALAYLNWLKKFAQAYLSADGSGNG